MGRGGERKGQGKETGEGRRMCGSENKGNEDRYCIHRLSLIKWQNIRV